MYSHAYWKKREQLATQADLEGLEEKEEQQRLTNLLSSEAGTSVEPKGIQEALQAINQELKAHYNGDPPGEEPLFFSSRARERFLLEKRAYLEAKQAAIEAYTRDLHQEAVVETIFTRAQKFFDQIKKLIDLIDDAWRAIRAKIPTGIQEILGPFLLSIPGFLLHLYEGTVAIKRSVQAYQNAKTPQRKTRIATGLLSFMFAGTGAGLALSLLAAIFGATIAGTAITLAPILIPALMVGIYGAALYWKAYAFDQSKAKESEVEALYKEALIRIPTELAPLSELIKKLEQKKNALYQQYREAMAKQKTGVAIDKLREEYEKVAKEFLEKQQDHATKEGELQGLEDRYHHFHHERLEAEREVAFTTIEVFCSTLVTISIVLGSTALLGAASVASFGVVPFALLITGIILGVVAKILEKQDEKYHFAFTRALRNAFVGLMEKLKRVKKAKSSPDGIVILDHLQHDKSRSALPTAQAAPLNYRSELHISQGPSTPFLDQRAGKGALEASSLKPEFTAQWYQLGSSTETQYRFIRRGDKEQLTSSLQSLQTLLNTAQSEQPLHSLTQIPKLEKGDIILSAHSLSEKEATAVKIGVVGECITPGQEISSKLVLPEEKLSSAMYLRIVDRQIQEGSKLLNQASSLPMVLTLYSLKLDPDHQAKEALEPIDLAFIQYALAMGLTCQVIEEGKPVILAKRELEALAPGVDREGIMKEIQAYRTLSSAEKARLSGIGGEEEKGSGILQKSSRTS